MNKLADPLQILKAVHLSPDCPRAHSDGRGRVSDSGEDIRILDQGNGVGNRYDDRLIRRRREKEGNSPSSHESVAVTVTVSLD